MWVGSNWWLVRHSRGLAERSDWDNSRISECGNKDYREAKLHENQTTLLSENPFFEKISTFFEINHFAQNIQIFLSHCRCVRGQVFRVAYNNLSKTNNWVISTFDKWPQVTSNVLKMPWMQAGYVLMRFVSCKLLLNGLNDFALFNRHSTYLIWGMYT